MRVKALRCALRRGPRQTPHQTPRQTLLCRRGLHHSSRFEDTSVSAVNAWLAEPPSKPTWTIAGACAAHDVFDLNADVVVAVDEGDEPCEPWVAATRIAVPTPPVALGSGAADALPDELADEALLAMAPERLTFALCGVGTAETVFERLESLFPGARAVACAAPAVARQRRGAGEERLVGAVFTDLVDVTPLARALAEFSTPADRTFRANAAAAREIFLPSSAPCLDGGDITPADQAVPLFVLDGVKLKEGEARVFKIFEPRCPCAASHVRLARLDSHSPRRQAHDQGVPGQGPAAARRRRDGRRGLALPGRRRHPRRRRRFRRRPPLRTNCQGRRKAGVAGRVRTRARRPRRVHEPVPRPVNCVNK